jgi:CrcB protein
MKKYLFIGLGGILGTFLRYFIRNTQIYNYYGIIPINTLAVNILGSFMLGIIFEIREINTDLRLGITAGFLGAFTTFSTLCMETAGLMQAQNYFAAFSYIIISIVSGLAAAYLGIISARKVISKKQDESRES